SVHPLAARFLVFLLLPLCLVSGVIASRLLASLPETSGEHFVDRISSPVVITRDEHGVAHIRARTDRDAFFAMGYVHAQDRMWQLELQRRTVQGRLSEVFGRESVRQDIWLRTLNLHQLAGSAWSVLSEESCASLTSYADGVNAWLGEHHELPPEFTLLGVTPEPWTAIDSLAWVKMFALDLGGN